MKFVSFDLAFQLKEAGFNLTTNWMYDDRGNFLSTWENKSGHANENDGFYSAPYIDHAIDWMEENGYDLALIKKRS